MFRRCSSCFWASQSKKWALHPELGHSFITTPCPGRAVQKSEARNSATCCGGMIFPQSSFPFFVSCSHLDSAFIMDDTTLSAGLISLIYMSNTRMRRFASIIVSSILPVHHRRPHLSNRLASAKATSGPILRTSLHHYGFMITATKWILFVDFTLRQKGHGGNDSGGTIRQLIGLTAGSLNAEWVRDFVW